MNETSNKEIYLPSLTSQDYPYISEYYSSQNCVYWMSLDIPDLHIVNPAFSTYTITPYKERAPILHINNYNRKYNPDFLANTLLLLFFFFLLAGNRKENRKDLEIISNRLAPLLLKYKSTQGFFWRQFYIKEFISSFLSYKISPNNYYFWSENKESPIKDFFE